MIKVSVNKLSAKLKEFVDKAIEEHRPIKATRREGKDFIIRRLGVRAGNIVCPSK